MNTRSITETRFAQNVKKLRTEKKLSQEALAERVGVAQQIISHYERGSLTPCLKNFVALARALNVAMEELVS